MLDLFKCGKYVSNPDYYTDIKPDHYETLKEEHWISKDFLRGLYVGNGKYEDGCVVLKIHRGDICDYIHEKLNIVSVFTENGLLFQNSNAIDFFGLVYTDVNELYSNKESEPLELIYGTDDPSRVPSIGIVIKHPDAITPSKSIFSDAGYDISVISLEKTVIENRTFMFDTGIQLRIPNGYYVELVPRSSLIKYGYILSNNVGIIDQSYMGNLKVCLTRVVDLPPKVIEYPFRCCQIILKKQYHAKIEVLDESAPSLSSSSTMRSEGGFGSTGR